MNSLEDAPNPVVAMVFSTFVPGLGQLYCGALSRGLFAGGLSLLALFYLLFFALGNLIATGLTMTLIFVMQVTEGVDAYLVSKRRTSVAWSLSKWVYPVYAGFLFVAVSTSFIVTKSLFFRAYRIPSAGMEHTLQIDDYIIADLRVYSNREPELHDLVIFRYPPSKELTYIKRCIGLPGDSVEIRDKRVFVNGRLIPEGHLSLRFASNEPVPRDRSYRNIFPHDSFGNADNYGPISVPRKGDTIRLDSTSQDLIVYLADQDGHLAWIDDDSVYVDSRSVTEYEVEANYYFVLGDNRDNSADSRFWGFVPRHEVIGKPAYVYLSFPQLSRIGTLIK